MADLTGTRSPDAFLACLSAGGTGRPGMNVPVVTGDTHAPALTEIAPGAATIAAEGGDRYCPLPRLR
ncbi:hypothetical protein ACSNOK_06410 [Streptomyces sp. URMC 126]|uniref:hypothetical protein n=1 Tax=Streptomyces sp. URMC 126 TaxID=3423401 RepID=UPI003F1BFCEB